MALIFVDNFEQYGICNTTVALDYMLDGMYTEYTAGYNSNGIVDDPDATAPASSIALDMGGYWNNGTSKRGFRYALPGGGRTTLGGSYRMFISQMPDINGMGPMIELRDGSNLMQVGFYVRTTGGISVWNSAGTVLGSTAGPALTANSWNHIEWKAVIHDTAGTFEIRVNGLTVLNLTSIDTKSQATTTVDQVYIGSNQSNTALSNPKFYVKDIIFWDTTGTRNNDFMGPCFVGRFALNGDTSFNWTPSTGTTGYNLINETGPNDTNYISAAWPAPAASTFGVDNLPADVTSVRAVVLLGRMRKSDGGDCNVQMSFVDAGTATNGTDRPITTADTYWYDILELNTRTSNPFTPTEFNNGTFKINRTL